MTESQWLTSTDPVAMLRATVREWEKGPEYSTIPVRKLRLIGCAALRLSWRALTSPGSREMVELGERIAEGLAEPVDCFESPDSFNKDSIGVCHPDPLRAVNMACMYAMNLYTTPADVANLMRDIVGNPHSPVRLPRQSVCPRCNGQGGYDWGTYGEERDNRIAAGEPTEGYEQCIACAGSGKQLTASDILTPTVVALAKAAYDERQPDEMECPGCKGWGVVVAEYDRTRVPCERCRGSRRTANPTAGLLDPVRLLVLADALEEAGYQERAILDHLRNVCTRCHGTRADPYRDWGASSQPPPPYVKAPCETCKGSGYSEAIHVRGCYAVDLVLGKE